MSRKDLGDEDYFFEGDFGESIDDFGDEFNTDSEFGDEFSEEEITPVDEINRLNDIHNFGEIRDVDISHTFLLSELLTETKLSKNSTKDLIVSGLKELNFKNKNKISLKKLDLPINDIGEYTLDNTVSLVKNIDEKKVTNNMDNISKKVDDIIIKTKIPNEYREKISSTLKKVDEKIPRSLNIDISGKIKPKKLEVKKPKISLKFLKPIFIILFLMGFIFCYGIYTKAKLENTFENIKNISKQDNLGVTLVDINDELHGVKRDLLILNTLLKPIVLFNHFSDNQKITNLDNLVSGGIELSDFGLNMVKIYKGFSTLIGEKGPDGIKYTQLFKNIDPLLLNTLQNLDDGINYFSKINDLQNDNLNQILSSKLELLKEVKGYFEYFYDNKQQIESILGDEREKTYMVVFQNSDEIRPTGGFMGSTMFVTLYKGKVINMEKKDIYALEYLLKPYKLRISSPEGINKLSQYFGLRDSNYYFDIQRSSESIKSYIDYTDYDIDGIVYINQNLVKDFLKKYGEVEFPFVNEAISYENFSQITSTLVEAKVTKTEDVTSTPKQILFDFVDLYIKELKLKGDYLGYINLFFDSINKRDVIFYSFDKNDDDFIKQIGLRTDVDYSKTIDYNYPIFTSISGNKSDRYISRDFQKTVTQNIDCSYDVDLTINLEHTFTYKDETSIKNFLYDMNMIDSVDLDYTLQIQGKQKNIAYVRVLLPENATISKKNGLQIYDIDDHNEVGFYMTTELYGKSSYTINYNIPNETCTPYSYLFVKQPGISNYSLEIQKDNYNIVNESELTHNYEYVN